MKTKMKTKMKDYLVIEPDTEDGGHDINIQKVKIKSLSNPILGLWINAIRGDGKEIEVLKQYVFPLKAFDALLDYKQTLKHTKEIEQISWNNVQRFKLKED